MESEEGTKVDDFSARVGDHVGAGGLGEEPGDCEVDGDDLGRRGKVSMWMRG